MFSFLKYVKRVVLKLWFNHKIYENSISVKHISRLKIPFKIENFTARQECFNLLHREQHLHILFMLQSSSHQ